MRTCGCGPRGIRGFFGRKLGKCPRCMRLAALFTAAGAALPVAAHALGAPATVSTLLLVPVAAFALLLAAHAAAFLDAARRARAVPRTAGVALDRRAFVGLGAAAFLLVLLGAPLPAWAGGNPGKCKYDKKNDKCDPADCGKIYDAQGKDVSTSLTCAKLTVDGTTDCHCIYTGADTCNDGKGNCTEVRKCPDLYESPKKQNALVKKCLKSGGVCYCAYTKK